MSFDFIHEAPPTGGWGLFRPAYLGDPLWTLGKAPFDNAATTIGISVTAPLAITRLDDLLRAANAPALETVQAAKSIYYVATAQAEPEVHSAPDGEVTLVWRRGSRYLEIGVDADGAVSYYGRAPGEQPLLGDLDAVPDSLPESVVGFLGGFDHGVVRVRGRAAERV